MDTDTRHQLVTRNLQKIITDKTAIADGLPVPIKRTLSHMAGKTLTKKQVEGNRKAIGHPKLFLLNQVVNLIEADLIDLSNVKVMERLAYLRTLIAGVTRKAGLTRKVAA
ncbi:hypothetical protein LCGC14_1738410 [marine sediment metagenome]|uniref:Uncharacterized protein n=1 Tax=marine sediment metagenome TaxID=412755 RepID=A0A0F9HV38_9ZZZZ